MRLRATPTPVKREFDNKGNEGLFLSLQIPQTGVSLPDAVYYIKDIHFRE